MKPIDPKALKGLLDAGNVELFDVRPDDERARASIAQAKKLDAAGQEYLFGLKKDAAVALHCHHGVRSRSAAEQLLREGFTNVYNLEGGIEAWSREGGYVGPAVLRDQEPTGAQAERDSARTPSDARAAYHKRVASAPKP